MVMPLLVFLAAMPAEKLVITDVQAFEPGLTQLAGQTQERLATELSKLDRFDVVTSRDVAALLGVERQKQLLGCTSDSNACTAEISDALGAPWLVVATLGKAPKGLRFDFKLIAASKGNVVVRDGGDVSADELPALVAQIVQGVQLRLGASKLERPSPPSNASPFVLMGLGGAALIAGGIGFALLEVERADKSARASMLPALEVQKFNANYAVFRPLWLALGITGAAAAIGGLVWLLVQPKPVGQLNAWLSASPAGLVVAGAF